MMPMWGGVGPEPNPAAARALSQPLNRGPKTVLPPGGQAAQRRTVFAARGQHMHRQPQARKRDALPEAGFGRTGARADRAQQQEWNN